MKIVRTERDLRGQIWDWRGAGHTIGFVPTMGALHDGHLSLVGLSRAKAGKTVASIYVNPTQFAEGEDLEAYPRDEARDCQLLADTGCDLVYLPDGSLYGPNHTTTIAVGGAALGLETDYRPHFFGGVALVVAKLFGRVQPDLAVFGEKDYQQLLTIRRLTADLDMPIQIIGAPIAREPDGLAMSSRNRYFDAQGRAIAGQLNIIMRDCAAAIKSGTLIEAACASARLALLNAGFDSVDYVAAADTQSLSILDGALAGRNVRLLIAATCKGVRLIDNCAI